MTDQQFSELLAILRQIASQQYTITGAADWPILVALGGVILGLIAFMWVDLKSTIKGDKNDLSKDIDNLWQAHRDCQAECCPRKKE